MAKKIYLNQIQAKIDRLQRERKQVLEHLALVESKLDKLQAAIEVMQSEALTDMNTIRSFILIKLINAISKASYAKWCWQR